MTKSSLLLILAFLVFNLQAFSQEREKGREKPAKGYLGIAFGPSLVSGNFGNTDWANDSAGFAKNGYNFTILEFGFKFIKNFGMTAAIKGAVIPLDVQALADGYASEYGGQFTVKSTRWGYTGFFVGPFLSFPTKYFDFDVKLETGLLMASAPEMTVSRDNQVAGQQSTVGASISIMGGVGARIHLSKKFGLLTSAEYHFSEPTFQTEIYDTSNNYETYTTSQRITLFNFTFGIVYRLFPGKN